jgi:hypothetical protein
VLGALPLVVGSWSASRSHSDGAQADEHVLEVVNDGNE